MGGVSCQGKTAVLEEYEQCVHQVLLLSLLKNQLLKNLHDKTAFLAKQNSRAISLGNLLCTENKMTNSPSLPSSMNPKRHKQFAVQPAWPVGSCG